ncbi:hypothetical protein [Streptomyces sp. KAU_LT]|uniref:hypothetical protein n=1 Tax=Streptomyces sp. KAU_LT TaxID=3046669 RepID=UPI0024B76E84|nr:hypothetical protein [Streptomyces sp. KAU_LT]MDI9832244.1 hypothetical protein [Streptomyces sp. KAU_LT]
MTTRIDGDEPDGRALADDDPLVVVLRPPSEHLAPPPGRYEAIRRRASRRRLARTAAGVGVTCAVALLAALPFTSQRADPPATPAPPLAPPTGGRSAPATPVPVPTPSTGPSERRTPSSPPARTGPSTPTEGSREGVTRAPEDEVAARPTAETTASPSARGETPQRVPVREAAERGR